MSPSEFEPSVNNAVISPTTKQINKIKDASTRRILGKHEARSLVGQELFDNLEELERINPQLGRQLIEYGFGISRGSALGYRESAMIIMAALVALGDTADQIRVYLKGALMHGATENEILDMINQVSGFVGAPRAVNGVRAVADMLKEARSHRISGITEILVHIGDHETLVTDTGGEGVPIILIHALSMDGRMWRDVLPKLASEARVITYDLRGHGQARGAPLTKSLDHLAEDLKILLDTLCIDRADLYGASYGGGIAQHFALAYSQRVRSLALIATTSKTHHLLRTRAERAEEHGLESLVPESIIRWFLPETIASDAWMVRYARACVRKARVEDWAAAWRAMADLDCISRIGEWDFPVLVLAGAQDASTPPSMMKPAYEGLKHGEYRELNPGTHMMVMEQAEAAAVEFVAFRQKVDQVGKSKANLVEP